jgi:hypothetical protein
MTVVGADVVEIPQDFTGDWAVRNKTLQYLKMKRCSMLD